jgi:hypothetical protein
MELGALHEQGRILGSRAHLHEGQGRILGGRAHLLEVLQGLERAHQGEEHLVEES